MSGWSVARNLLAVRLDNAGDVIMLGPALRAVKEATPDARITLLASPAGTAAAALLPWLDDVITLRAVWQDVGGRVPFDPARELALVDSLRERAFDAALIFTSFSQTPHAAGYACYLAGIPLRAGSGKEFGGSVLTTELRSNDDAPHQAERDLRLVEAVGYAVRDRSLAIRIPAAARSGALGVLDEIGVRGRAFVLAHPGASAAARRYPPDRLREAIAIIADQGIDVVVTGTEREREVVALATPPLANVHPIVGGLSLPEYAALIERAAVVVCGNTLPLHLADALRVPVVSLYSGTDLESQWRPRDTDVVLLRVETPCHPCYLFECPIGLPCLDIAPELVAKEVLDAADRRAACAAAG